MPVEGVPDLLKNVGVRDEVDAWMRTAFGFSPGNVLVPNRILLPYIQPVAEVFRPRFRFLTFKDPPVNQAMVITPDPGVRWEIVSLHFQLATVVAVANRAVHVQITSPVLEVFRGGANIDQAASLTFDYFVSPMGIIGSLVTQAGTFPRAFHIPIPPGLALFGKNPRAQPPDDQGQLSVSGANLQAGDGFSGFRMVVAEWAL